MTLRTYLRFLRPVRCLLVIAFYTFTASAFFGHALFHFDPVTSRFLALATVLPLMIGIAIAGAAHEPMHRAFFLLLPDGAHRMRNATLLAVAVFACAVTCVVALAEPSVPPFATLGLAAGLIAVFCIDRHQSFAGLGAWAVAFWGWVLFNLTVGRLLRPAMIAAPWAFLLGGLTLAAIGLTVGFSRRHLRQRGEVLFVSIQSIVFSHLFRPHVMARWTEEVALYRSRLSKGFFAAGRDWSIRSVGSSTWAWMHVFWHAFAGRRRHNNFLRSQLTTVAPVFAGGLAGLIITGILMGPSHAMPDYWRILATMAAPENMLPTSAEAGFVWIAGGVMQAGAAAFSLLMILPPQLAYPISRERLARVVFGLSLVQLAVALALPATAVFLLSLLGQIATGHFWPGGGLPGIVALDLALAVCLPWLACAGSFSHPAVRVLWAIPVAGALLTAVITRGSWTPLVLTVPGSIATVAVASASVSLLWLCLRRHYRTCDLFSNPGMLNTRL